jgi:hypothetical protein
MLLACQGMTYEAALMKMGQWVGMLNAWIEAGWLAAGKVNVLSPGLLEYDNPPHYLSDSGYLTAYPRGGDPVLSAVLVLRRQRP